MAPSGDSLSAERPAPPEPEGRRRRKPKTPPAAPQTDAEPTRDSAMDRPARESDAPRNRAAAPRAKRSRERRQRDLGALSNVSGVAHLVRAGALLLLALSMAGLFSRFGYPLDILTHFRFHFAVSGVVLALATLMFPSAGRVALLAALAATGLNGALVFLALQNPAPRLAGDAATTVLWAHVDQRDTVLWAAAGLARETAPDVVALTAVPQNAALETLFPQTPCIERDASNSRYAVAMLSRGPCAPRGPAIGGPWPYAAQRATLRSDIAVVGVHAPRPIDAQALLGGLSGWRDAGRVRLRDAVITAASDAVWGDPPALLIGDFNAAPWSAVMGRQAEQGLRLVDCGAPWRSTWPTTAPLAGLPMDQAWVSGALAARCVIGPSLGARHRPIIVELGPAAGDAG